jgi:hypothetical protein
MGNISVYQRCLLSKMNVDEGSIGLIILSSISILIGIGFHYKLKKPIVATILSTFSASIAFQVIVYVDLGYLDPFFFIAFILSSGITFLISLLVGIPFIYYRRKRS